MKGDFTRSTFHREKHYSSVRWQQGRVQTDADWNEEIEILAHRDHTTRRDVIGPCGGPQGNDSEGSALAGFLVDVADGQITISQGRYYVDGLLCENEADVPITEQPDLPYPPENTLADVFTPPLEPEASPEPGVYLAYLDVWEHHVTALEDSYIHEVALGGPDTTTRTKTVWQVKLLRTEADDAGAINCASELPQWEALTAPSSGRLRARAEPAETETEPCDVPARAGYRGLENQLYRVEVHRILSANEISIKWSRENGSVVMSWTGQDNLDPNKLTVSGTGRDEVLGLAADDWVELSDDRRELRGLPGSLVQITNVEGNVLTINPGGATVTRPDDVLHPKVRRWDMPRDVGEITVDPTVADQWIELEKGVQVRFEPGVYRTGDYWLIPARTATRDIEWPREEGSSEPLPQPPHGIYHHYCRLALLDFDGETWTRRSDCRNLFPPLTALVDFFHVGGDGQEAMPGARVPQTLDVGVVNGLAPVENATVRFRIVEGPGGVLEAGGASGDDVTVTSGPGGVYSCNWQLANTPVGQRVEATLLEIDGKPLVDGAGNPLLTPIRFNANLSIAAQVAYDPRNCSDLQAASVRTVQEAIDFLCRQSHGGCCVTVGEGGEYGRLDEALRDLLRRGERDICICLLPGDHPMTDPEAEIGEPENIHIKITGCGPGSRLFLERPLSMRSFRSWRLHDLAFQLLFAAEDERGAIAFDRCAEVMITGCRVAGFTVGTQEEPRGALLSIANADQVTLRDNLFEAGAQDSLALPRQIFAAAQVDFLADLFSLPERGEFGIREFEGFAREIVANLLNMNRDERQQVSRAIATAIVEFRGQLSESELFSVQKLVFELNVAEPAGEDLFDTLLDIRRTSIQARPGVAIILGSELLLDTLEDLEIIAIDSDDHVSVHNNVINGILSLYGLPPSRAFIAQNFNADIQGLVEEALASGRLSLRDGIGLFGSVHIEGNQLARVATSRRIFERVIAFVQSEQPPGLFGLFNRCSLGDNVFENSGNWFIIVRQSMSANHFAIRASRVRGELGIVVADSAVYVGNQGGDPDWVLRDLSRRSEFAANLDIAIG